MILQSNLDLNIIFVIKNQKVNLKINKMEVVCLETNGKLFASQFEGEGKDDAGLKV